MSESTEAVSKKTKARLDEESWKRLDVEWQRFYLWMRREGKDPDNGEGLAENGADNYLSRLDQVHRALWDEFGQDPLLITPRRATAFVDMLENDDYRQASGETYSSNSKRKLVNAIQKYGQWKALADDAAEWCDWEPQTTFRQTSYDSADTFTLEESGRLVKAAKRINELPEYDELSAERRDEIKTSLAQRFGKPKSCIGPEDWGHEENGAKIPSLVLTAQDAALPAIEVGRASVDWVKWDEGVLRIPEEHASKERETTEITLSDEAMEYLERWKEERKQYEKYDDSDALWLNERGNRYNSKTLNYLLRKLCREANIDVEGRDICWYSIRHTTASYIKEYDSIEAVQELLRHESPEMAKTHYNQKAQEVQRHSVNDVRDLANKRANGELTEKQVGAILKGDTRMLFEALVEDGSLLS